MTPTHYAVIIATRGEKVFEECEGEAVSWVGQGGGVVSGREGVVSVGRGSSGRERFRIPSDVRLMCMHRTAPPPSHCDPTPTLTLTLPLLYPNSTKPYPNPTLTLTLTLP